MLAADEEIKKCNIKDLCAFCRTPMPRTLKEQVKAIKKRVKLKDPVAIFNLGCAYYSGMWGLQQDMNKALELFYQAADLGNCNAHYSIGNE